MAYYWGQQPREITVAEATTAVGELVYHLQQNLYSWVNIRVTEVVKAGSLGHGTAVSGEFDLDLVLYSQDIDANVAARNGFKSWLDKIDDFLRRTLGRKYEHQKNTPHAVQFKYDGKIEVDLLVSPYWASKEEFYRFLKTLRPEKRFDFSAAASKWQVQFFQHQGNQVKEFIRRAKAWRNRKWPKSSGGSGRPKSFFLSVLVLSAYERATAAVGQYASTQTIARKTTEELKYLVANHRRLNIFWEENYKQHTYRDLFPTYTPYVVDPANPSNNLYETGITRSYRANERARDYERGEGDWTELVRRIDSVDLTKTPEEM